MRRLTLPFAFGLLVSCGPSTQPPRSTPGAESVPEADPAPPARADGRLPPGVRPLEYRLELTVDPKEARFIGRAQIAIQIDQPTRSIVLHGRDLSVLTAAITSGSGKQWAKARLRRAAGSKREPEELVLVVPRELKAGRGEIDVQYEAPFAAGLAGLYRVREGGRWYAFTQFEPTDARRAFPCFDEPSFKVPFELLLTTPQDLVAVANTPLVRREEHFQSQLATHYFAKSPPLPSYLIAMAIGELDVVDGPQTPVPIRAITAKGKAGLAALAIETAKEQLALFADYFGEPYPYAKLDLVAVPDFAAGAMENPGLITFREELLLLDPKQASASARRALAGVTAHELAHQWFGNLVTLGWWDDLWLNEGFASWMGTKIVDRHKPGLAAGLEALSSKSRVMGIDALRGARKVRQPVQSSSEALEAFDGITYVKGMSILGMTESWVGEQRFQAGVRRYIAEHRHQTATARDLFEALGGATGERVAEVMDTFLDQTGVPLVDARVDCAAKKLWLSQSEYRPLGVEAGPLKRWRFPVCVRYLAGKPRRACTLLQAEGGELGLEGGVCPKLIYPNAADRGYYHFAIAEAELSRLAQSTGFLEDSERLGLVGNAWALVKSGALGADAYLRLLGFFSKEKSRVTWERIIGSLDELERIVGAAERPRFARFATGLLGPMARRLGFAPRSGESDDQRLLRRTLLSALGRLGDDPWVRTEAARVAHAWRDDPRSVDADVAAVAVAIDAERGDEQLFKALSARLVRVQPPEQRLIAIGGLAGLSEPKLVERVLALVLDPNVFKAQDVRYLLTPLFARHETRDVAWAWTRANYPALEKRLPPFVFGRMAWVIANFCDDAQVEAAAKFFEPKLGKIEGADKPMRQAVEAGKLCAALARGQREALARGLGASPKYSAAVLGAQP